MENGNLPPTPEVQEGDVFFANQTATERKRKRINDTTNQESVEEGKIVEAAEKKKKLEQQVRLHVVSKEGLEEQQREDDELTSEDETENGEVTTEDEDVEVIEISDEEGRPGNECQAEGPHVEDIRAADDEQVYDDGVPINIGQEPVEIIWVREVVPINPFYVCIPLCARQGNPGPGKTPARAFPTELIPEDSIYWAQYLLALQKNNPIREPSVFDHVMVSAYKYGDGRIKITRNYVNVIIRKGDQRVLRRPVDLFYVVDSEVRNGVFPTDMIPADSPYYISTKFKTYISPHIDQHGFAKQEWTEWS